MKKISQPKKEDFDALLNWFSLNKEEAGKEYEKIRQWLITFFEFKGCSDTELLADETLNRVALKLPTLNKSKNVKKTSIFYGFAHNVFREYIKGFNRKEVQLEPTWNIPDDHSEPLLETENNDLNYLDKCMDKLSLDDKELILEYYSEEKSAKIELRKRLAKKLNLKLETLHVKIYRIKKILKKCIEGCIKNNHS